MIDTFKQITDLLTFEHNEFLTEISVDNVLSIAEEIETYFYENEPLTIIMLQDIDWLEIAKWVQSVKTEWEIA